MCRNFKKTDIAAILLLIGLIAGFYFFNPGQVRASPGGVEFTSDVVLELQGLDTTTYIAAGSKADYLTISGTTLSVYGIPAAGMFLLKTDSHKVLQLAPIDGTADFIFSSVYVSSGYVSQWTGASSVSVAHTVGVPKASSEYNVTVGGVLYGTYNSGPAAEISFGRTGSGSAETFTVEEKEEEEIVDVCQIDTGNALGWAWSENFGWISFSCRNEMEVGVEGPDYGVEVNEETGLFSGYAWSEHIGWISFESERQAMLDLDTYKISGWAKVLSNDSWISLRDAGYGVSWNGANQEFELSP